MLLNEFRSEDQYKSAIFPSGEAVREHFDAEDESFGFDMIVVLCYGILFYIIGYFVLSRKNVGKR